MAEMSNEELCQMSLKEGEAGLAKISDFSKIKLEGKEGGGEAQMVSSSKSKRGSSLARLPDDMLYYILTSFLLFKDLLSLDCAWTVRRERETCWLPVLHKFFGHSPVLLKTGKYEFIVSDSLFLRVSSAWIHARSLPLARVIAPSEHGLSVELDRLTDLSLGSVTSLKSDLAAVSSWLRVNSLPVPKHTLDVIFTGREIGATRALRHLVSLQVNPPIQQVVDIGVVPRFVEFLHRLDNPDLQYEAAWALTNIASGTSEHTQRVAAAGAVPIFVKLLASPHQDICEQAAWALGNVAGDSVLCRDLVLQHGAVPALVELGSTFSNSSPMPLVRNVSWTLSNLCRDKPEPPLDLVSPALPLLARLIHNNDMETVTDACWALSYMSEGPDDRIEAVLHAGVAPRLVELLQGETTALTPALRTVGNIATGDIVQTQRILDLNVLPVLLKLLDSRKKNIRKEAAWVVSNITAGTRAQIQVVIEAGLVPKLIELLQTVNGKVKKEAAWAVANVANEGDAGQIAYLVQQGAIPPLCKLLDSHDAKVVELMLEGLQKFICKLSRDARKMELHVILQCDGNQKIKALQTHPNSDIAMLATAIMKTYFPQYADK